MAEHRALYRGLSPRVRGNPYIDAAAAAYRRSIPACAGEPGGLSHSDYRGRVYPRVCGGTLLPAVKSGGLAGLSPRVRGNPETPERCTGLSRSIPACAGEPMRLRGMCGYKGVYPRVCGGTQAGPPPAARPAGLSPRVRGNRTEFFAVQHWPGSIPACAGEPDPADQGSLSRHGLSPRVRGNPCPAQDELRQVGSIPACAGEPPDLDFRH